MKNSKFLRSKNLLKSLEAEELKSLNNERQKRKNNGNIDSVSVCGADARNDRRNSNDNERQLKTMSARNDRLSSIIPEIGFPVVSSERSDERSAVSVRRCRSSVIPEIRNRESMVNKKTLSCAAFTLVELVITVAIVIILSVISVPIYRGYVDKAKWSEAYALLGTVLSAQKAYYSEYGNFLKLSDSSGVTEHDTVLGIDARGNKYFTRFQVGTDLGDCKLYFKTQTIKCSELDNWRLFLYYNITLGPKWTTQVDNSWVEEDSVL